MGKHWGKEVRKTKRSLKSRLEEFKQEERPFSAPVKNHICEASPDVCIVRQVRNPEQCNGCGIFKA